MISVVLSCRFGLANSGIRGNRISMIYRARLAQWLARWLAPNVVVNAAWTWSKNSVT